MTQTGNVGGKPWYAQKTAWATIGGVAAAWVPFLVGWSNHLTHDQLGALATTAIGITFAAIGSVFARQGGVDAANEVGQRTGVVPPAADKETTAP